MHKIEYFTENIFIGPRKSYEQNEKEFGNYFSIFQVV